MDAVTVSQGVEVITGMQLWFLFSLDSIKSFLSSAGFFTFFTCVSIIITAVLFVVKLISRGCDDDKTAEKVYETTSELFPKFLKASIFLAAFTSFTSFVGFVLPTTKQMAAIIVIPKIVNNEKIQEIPPKLIQLGSTYLEDWINEMKNLDSLKKEEKETKTSKEK